MRLAAALVGAALGLQICLLSGGPALPCRWVPGATLGRVPARAGLK